MKGIQFSAVASGTEMVVKRKRGGGYEMSVANKGGGSDRDRQVAVLHAGATKKRNPADAAESVEEEGKDKLTWVEFLKHVAQAMSPCSLCGCGTFLRSVAHKHICKCTHPGSSHMKPQRVAQKLWQATERALEEHAAAQKKDTFGKRIKKSLSRTLDTFSSLDSADSWTDEGDGSDSGSSVRSGDSGGSGGSGGSLSGVLRRLCSSNASC